jgi:hypothetical protein
LNITNLKKEYARAIIALNRTGILILVPRSKKLGVIGIDGKGYPVPTQEQLLEVFTRNKELVDRKMRQGFTRLLLTPIAMPIPQLIDLAKTELLRHSAAGKIIQTKRNPYDADISVRVNTVKPIWIWDRVRKVLDTPKIVYFPQAYMKNDHQGLTKEKVIHTSPLCALPGWSVGLIEPIPIMSGQGQGKVMGGRKQLEGNSAPRDYLRTLSTPAYQGETGWTLEDFLTHFITHLETTNQVSHDRYDANALWLFGSYIPDLMPKALVVPVGYWSRNVGRKMYLSAHRTANRFKYWVGRSIVRLGANGASL